MAKKGLGAPEKASADDANHFPDIFTLIDYIKNASTTEQLIAGGASGFISGFLTAKIGKATLLGMGISAVFFHFAQKYGYVKINTNKLNKDLEIASKKIKKELDEKLPGYIERVKRILYDHGYLSLGFSGGFFLGLTY